MRAIFINNGLSNMLGWAEKWMGFKMIKSEDSVLPLWGWTYVSWRNSRLIWSKLDFVEWTEVAFEYGRTEACERWKFNIYIMEVSWGKKRTTIAWLLVLGLRNLCSEVMVAWMTTNWVAMKSMVAVLEEAMSVEERPNNGSGHSETTLVPDR